MKTLLHFAHPLFYIAFFILASGLVSLRKREARVPALFFVAAALFLLAFTGWPLVFGPPADVAAIRNADASEVTSFEIGPLLGQPSSGDLVDRPVRVTDRPTIEKLVALLQSSTHAAPNHPNGGWATRLVIVDGTGRHAAKVASTSDGLLISIGDGAVGRVFRQEELKDFLEEVARTIR